jgi:preprotein translocase subunit SecE
VRRAGLPPAVRPAAGSRHDPAPHSALTRHPPTTEEGEVAESNRPGDDAADDRPDDEVFEDAVADDDEPVTRGGGTATRERKAESDNSKAKKDVRRAGIFGRIGGFFREVVAELRKVIWPTRKELLTYTSVVIVFLVIMTSIVTGLDFGFAKLVLWAFGNAGK